MDRQGKDSDVFEPASSNNAKQRAALVEWLNAILPELSLPINASDEELRAFLVDGSVLCRLLNKLKPGCVTQCSGSVCSTENVQRFLTAMDEMGLPRFQQADLEKGSMKIILDCLLTLQTHFMLNGTGAGSRRRLSGECPGSADGTPRQESFRLLSSPSFGEDRRKLSSDSKFQRALRSTVITEPSPAAINHVGHKFHEVFQLKQGSYRDLPAAKISEMMKSNSLDNAPTQSLLSVVNGILDESIERKHGEIPHRVACLLRKVVQEIERRICTQAEHLRTQNNLFKAREEKYQSRIRVLEALATGTSEETQIVMNQLQQIKSEKNKTEERKKVEEQDITRLTKEKDELNQEMTNLRQEIATLRHELEIARKSCELKTIETKVEVGRAQQEHEDRLREALSSLAESKNRMKELEDKLKEAQAQVGGAQLESENRLKETQSSLTESRNRVKELEDKLKEAQAQAGGAQKDSENRLKETLSSLIESRNRVKELEDKLKEAQAQTGGAQQESENRLKETMSSLIESRNKVKELEDKLKEAQAQVGVGGAQQESENRLKETLSSLTESRNKVKELEDKLKEAQAQVGGAQQESENRLKETLSSLTELRNRVKELEDKLKEVQAEAGGAQKECEDRLRETLGSLTESRNRVKELEDKLKEVQVEAGGAQKECEDRLRETLSSLTESRNRVKELEDKLKEVQAEAGGAQQECEDRLREALSSLTKSRNRVKELEDKLKEALSSLADSRSRMKELEDQLKEAQSLLTESRNRVKELEALLESRSEWWNKKQHIYQIFTEFQLGALRELKFSSQFIRQEVVKTQKTYSDNFAVLGSRIKTIDHAVKSYYSVLTENQKLHNELQELKGNIRVYCRVRPFLPGQKGKQTVVEYVGENGELIVVNPSKAGKEGRRSFKFDKVYGPTATQAQVFTDTQPLIQSVLDGYNVCIFAYGQTGSGKTYTMTGPDGASEEEWGVNYRALNNLFRISQSRESTFTYEICVQMVEIYNEQVRDLLSNDTSQKKLGILSTSQPNGLAVPDAAIHPVNSTSDVLVLMDIGLKNRAKSSTALNERSSRSHSIVSIHARGTDLKSGSSLRGSLHLVDLAGSERVDRSEVTGDRLREAQHINKSLSALGDVIFALAQKSSHVPYRNSKLTQVLQSSLGGHAKTLMFVQLNPDATSYSESISTLKFAERVSGVELGAAKSSKDGRDVRELMEQVASLKDTIAKKDEEIETLQLLKDPKNGAASLRYLRTSPSEIFSWLGLVSKTLNRRLGK